MTRTSFLSLVTGGFLSSRVSTAAPPAAKSWWPQFRGPFSTGIGEGNPPIQFGPAQKAVWKTPIGKGVSSPAIWDNRIFLTEADLSTKQLSTVCLDRRNGKLLWRRDVPANSVEKVHEISSPAGSTPATDGIRVYSYFGSYGLLAYDFTGKLAWERPLPPAENIYGAVASPLIAGDFLIHNHQGKDAYLLAVNRTDGRTVWKTDRTAFQFGWSSPIHWHHDGIDEILVLGGDFKPNQRLMAYNLADGAERWWIGGLPPCGKSTPVIGDGLVYFCAPDIILDPEAVQKNPARAAQIYENNASRVTAVRPGGKGDVTQTHIAWSQKKGVPGVPSPLFYNGRLYSFLNGGIVYCRNAKTGEVIYNGRIGALGDYYSSPVAAAGKIYIASSEGVVSVLEAGDQLKVLANNNFDSPIMATPALVDNKIYVRTADHLYALGA